MPELTNILELNKCPHCKVDKPNLITCVDFSTQEHSGGNPRHWKCYRCARCGGVVTASARSNNAVVLEMFPRLETVNDVIPFNVKKYLNQAIDSQHSPDGAVMLSASAVDAMLKEKGLAQGKLYPRIKLAVKNYIITSEMGKWAHQVRLEANDSRHADKDSKGPTPEDAKNTINFALALAEYLFVLPSKVNRGLEDTTNKDSK